MTDFNVPVSEGTRVFLNFSVSLEDGSEVDTNFGGDPVDFAIGDGSLLPGFERRIFGMLAGDRQMFEVPPEDALVSPTKTMYSGCRWNNLTKTSSWKSVWCSLSPMPLAVNCRA
jgi:FKBP-type peptidyl-prolyl cis-trans isomerase 2